MPTYPLYSDPHADLHATSGRTLDEVTVAATVAGEITLDDLQIDKAALQAQRELEVLEEVTLTEISPASNAGKT